MVVVFTQRERDCPTTEIRFDVPGDLIKADLQPLFTIDYIVHIMLLVKSEYW